MVRRSTNSLGGSLVLGHSAHLLADDKPLFFAMANGVWQKRTQLNKAGAVKRFPGVDISELISFKYFEADPGDCTVFGKRQLHLSDPNATGPGREIEKHDDRFDRYVHRGRGGNWTQGGPRHLSDRAAFVVRVAVAQDGLLRLRRSAGTDNNSVFDLAASAGLKTPFQPDPTAGSNADDVVLNVSSPRDNALLQEVLMRRNQYHVNSLAPAFFLS